MEDTKCTESLAVQGANFELLANTGQSAFHHTAILEESETLRVLLRLVRQDSVMITVKDRNGNTALIRALRHRSLRCALMLLERADMGDIVGQDGRACIHSAARLGDVAIAGSGPEASKLCRGYEDNRWQNGRDGGHGSGQLVWTCQGSP